MMMNLDCFTITEFGFSDLSLKCNTIYRKCYEYCYNSIHFFYNTKYVNVNKLQCCTMFSTCTSVHDSIAILVLTDVIILYLIIIIILMDNYIHIELFSKVNFFGPVYICSNTSVHLYDYVHTCMFILAWTLSLNTYVNVGNSLNIQIDR